MNTALWVLAGLLAAAFTAAGLMKVTTPKQALVDKGMAWAAGWQPGAIKALGVAEILGAIALLLPPAVDVLPLLTPIAAALLALTMIGAVAVHVKAKEPFLPPLVLGVLAALLAVLRFGPYAF